MKNFDIIYDEITSEWLKSNPIKRIVDKFELASNRTLVLYGGVDLQEFIRKQWIA